jgi:hypothetical protein
VSDKKLFNIPKSMSYEAAHVAATTFTHSQVNAALKERADEWHWAKQPSGSISLPDYIQLRAKGEAKMANGHVYLKKPGPDIPKSSLY